LREKVDAFAMGFERAECALLIDTHQPAVARNIASQNSSEPALYAIFTQLRLPNTRASLIPQRSMNDNLAARSKVVDGRASEP
jgi:hypothetical protein